jgi:beta-lactamase regulating signal transducer with metallopeptidase domain
MTIIWMIIYLFIRKNASAKLIYLLLRCTITGYVFPVVFLFDRMREGVIDGPENILFALTYKINTAMLVVFCIWIAGVLIHVIIDFWSYVKFRRICGDRINVTPKYETLLCKVKSEVNIKRKIKIYYGYSVASPFVYGVIRPCVYIAPDKYSDEEIEMILVHELYHVKQGDIFWKPVFLLISCIYWFNPFAWVVLKQLRYWAEASCDEFCCIDRYDRKKYFYAICDLSDKTYKHTTKFAPMWSEGKDELRWRIKCMSRNIRKKITKKAVAVVAAFALFGAGISTYAADYSSVNLYNKIFLDTNEGITEEIADYEEGVEYTGTADEFEGIDVIEEPESLIATASTVKAIDWTIKKETAYASAKFKASKDSEIYVSVGISPSDKYVKVGIIQPDGTTRYVYSKGNITHSFKVTQAGYHKVYISNYNSSTVTAIGYRSYE